MTQFVINKKKKIKYKKEKKKTEEQKTINEYLQKKQIKTHPSGSLNHKKNSLMFEISTTAML